MSKKLWAVQAVDKLAFNNRPPVVSYLGDATLQVPASQAVTVLQVTKAKALKEAERLARLHKNHVFLVMEAVHVSYSADLVSQPLQADV